MRLKGLSLHCVRFEPKLHRNMLCMQRQKDKGPANEGKSILVVTVITTVPEDYDNSLKS